MAKYFTGVQIDQDAHVKMRQVIAMGKAKSMSDAVRVMYEAFTEKYGTEKTESKDEKIEKILNEASHATT